DDEQQGDSILQSEDGGYQCEGIHNTPADYRQLVALLESIKRPFFTYQLKEDRMDQRVIRGLRERCQSMTSRGSGEPRHRRRRGSAADLKDHKEATSALPRQDEDAGKACRDPEAGHAHGQLREEEKVFRAQPVLPLPAVRAHTAELPSR
ncbi:unnamed protein product, partial [Acanthoscelides obtectus]